MNITLTPAGRLDIETSEIALRGLHPVLNGVALDDARAELVSRDARRSEWRFSAAALGPATFGVEIVAETETRLWLRYWLDGLDAAADAFGVRWARVEGARSYLRSGYHSWDGSAYIEVGAAQLHGETGYALTQLLPRRGAGSLVIGFDRHDRFQQTFTFDAGDPPALTVLTWWDRKGATSPPCPPLLPGEGEMNTPPPSQGGGRGEGATLLPGEGEGAASERLLIFEHPEVEGGLRAWAQRVAEAAPIKPRHAAPITGWCSWYNLYAAINEENIREHLAGVARIAQRDHLPLRVFQIDDGFTPEMGDWLEVKPQFPRGMKPLLDDIRAAGFTPGLWIAPFMVGNRSRLYRQHPDWVVQDVAGGPLVHWRMYGEFRWHKRSEEYYILDATHPDAFAYLRRVFRTWRREWGCEYFKTDFMFWGAAYGPETAVWHTPGLTRIEIWRRVAEMIRREIGDALWLGCGCPLWAAVGLVDGVRIGRDVGVEWRDNAASRAILRDVAARNFGHAILWQADPDCILLRQRFHHLTDAQLRSLAIFAGMVGGVTMTSDALDELPAERLRLWKLLLAPGACRFPLLGGADPVLVQVREAGNVLTPFPPSPDDTSFRRQERGPGGEDLAAVHVFNTGDAAVERTYSLPALGLATSQYVYDWTRQVCEALPTTQVSVALAPHDSALLFLSPEPILAAPERLP